MSEKQFRLSSETVLQYKIMDNDTDLNENEVVDLLNKLYEENEQLRLELETHKHPLWSTREAEKKVNKLADSLADEVKKNGLLNEEINQLRIENMRLKKSEKINMEYAEQIVEENQKLRIAKNDLRIENERLKSRNNYNLEDCLLEIVELKEEKEQLKKKLESLQKVLHLVECVSDE